MFDGTSAPYKPEATTNPAQSYGETKRDGENAVLSSSQETEDAGAKAIVLRIPVLQVNLCKFRCLLLTPSIRYGPAPHNSDSAVNILLDVVQDQSGKSYKMDHYATRYPTNVIDIANFLVRLSGALTIGHPQTHCI